MIRESSLRYRDTCTALLKNSTMLLRLRMKTRLSKFFVHGAQSVASSLLRSFGGFRDCVWSLCDCGEHCRGDPIETRPIWLSSPLEAKQEQFASSRVSFPKLQQWFRWPLSLRPGQIWNGAGHFVSGKLEKKITSLGQQHSVSSCPPSPVILICAAINEEGEPRLRIFLGGEGERDAAHTAGWKALLQDIDDWVPITARTTRGLSTRTGQKRGQGFWGEEEGGSGFYMKRELRVRIPVWIGPPVSRLFDFWK